MQKWEYKVVGRLSEEALNELGEQGWELVAIYENFKAYLKRPKTLISDWDTTPGGHFLALLSGHLIYSPFIIRENL